MAGEVRRLLDAIHKSSSVLNVFNGETIVFNWMQSLKKLVRHLRLF